MKHFKKTVINTPLNRECKRLHICENAISLIHTSACSVSANKHIKGGSIRQAIPKRGKQTGDQIWNITEQGMTQATQHLRILWKLV